MPASTNNFKKGTNILMRQGHTTSAANGQDVNSNAKGSEAQAAKDLRA